MSLSVVTNISSLSAQAQLDKTNFELQQTLARLTSGLRNSAADDAAAAANRFRMDNAGLQGSIRAGNDAISRLQIEDSRIRDANIAEEAPNLTKFNILNQSDLAALAQANQNSSSVLSLLR